MNTTWLNTILNHICNSCGYEWIAPVLGKKCPICRSENIISNEEIKHLGPKRI